MKIAPNNEISPGSTTRLLYREGQTDRARIFPPRSVPLNGEREREREITHELPANEQSGFGSEERVEIVLPEDNETVGGRRLIHGLQRGGSGLTLQLGYGHAGLLHAVGSRVVRVILELCDGEK